MSDDDKPVGPTRLTKQQIRACRKAYERRCREITVEMAKATNALYVKRLDGLLQGLAREDYLMWGNLLTEWIASLCKRYRVPAKRTPLWLARWLADRPAFWRDSRRIRKSYSKFNEMHEVDVSNHVRAGAQVSAHTRLLGNEHLLALPVDDYPPEVGEVLRLMAQRAYRKPLRK